MIDLECEFKGVLYRNISQLILGTVAMDGSYLYYESNEASRSECFGQNLPTLIRISDSAQTAGHVVRERLENAMNSPGGREIYRQTIQNRTGPGRSNAKLDRGVPRHTHRGGCERPLARRRSGVQRGHRSEAHERSTVTRRSFALNR
jgi:hypothetical protein